MAGFSFHLFPLYPHTTRQRHDLDQVLIHIGETPPRPCVGVKLNWHSCGDWKLDQPAAVRLPSEIIDLRRPRSGFTSNFRWCISTKRSENTPNHVSIDLMAKRLRNNPRDAGIAKSWIAAFDFDDSVDGQMPTAVFTMRPGWRNNENKPNRNRSAGNRFGARCQNRQTTSSCCLSRRVSAMMPLAPPGQSSLAATVSRWIRSSKMFLMLSAGYQNR